MLVVILVGEGTVAAGDLAYEVSTAIGIGLGLILGGGHRDKLTVGIVLVALGILTCEREVRKVRSVGVAAECEVNTHAHNIELGVLGNNG